VTWNYAVSNAAVQYLADGEEATESFTVTIDDGNGGTVSQVVTVTVTGANDNPTDLTFSTLTVAENSADGTVVGSVTGVTDIDNTTGFTYSLLDNAGGRFQISAAGIITVANGASLDYESNTSHSITVQVTDAAGGTYSEVVAVGVTNVQEGAPATDLTLSITATPGGNNTPNNAIGQFAASGGIGPYSYSATVTESDLNGNAIADATPDFTVSSTGGLSAASVDAGRIYELSVQATSSGGTYTESFTIIVGTGGPEGSLNGGVSNLGEDVIYGLSGNDIIYGGGGGDTVFGQGGNDTIYGGDGNDKLDGGSGDDAFVFDTALNGTTNVDSIADFNANNTDAIRLSQAIFGGIGATLDAAEFLSVAGGAASNASQRIIFDTNTGNLYYDADGNGATGAVLFATVTLTGGGTFNQGDFLMIA